MNNDSSKTVAVGDWIRALEDDSIGRVVCVNGDVATVAWEGGVRVDYDLSVASYEVHETRAAAEAARSNGIDARGIA